MLSLPLILLGRAYGADMGKRPFGPGSLRRTKVGDETITPAPPTYTDKNGVTWVIFTRTGPATFPYLFDKKYKAHSYGYLAKGWPEKDLEADFWLGELKPEIDEYAVKHEVSPPTFVPKIDPAAIPSASDIGKSIGKAIGSAIPAPTSVVPAVPPSKAPQVAVPAPGPAPVPAGPPKPSPLVSKAGEATSPGLLLAAVGGALALGWVLLK